MSIYVIEKTTCTRIIFMKHVHATKCKNHYMKILKKKEKSKKENESTTSRDLTERMWLRLLLENCQWGVNCKIIIDSNCNGARVHDYVSIFVWNYHLSIARTKQRRSGTTTQLHSIGTQRTQYIYHFASFNSIDVI